MNTPSAVLVVATLLSMVAGAAAQAPSRAKEQPATAPANLYVPPGYPVPFREQSVAANEAVTVVAVGDETGLVNLLDTRSGLIFDTLPFASTRFALAAKNPFVLAEVEGIRSEFVLYDFESHRIADRIPLETIRGNADNIFSYTRDGLWLSPDGSHAIVLLEHEVGEIDLKSRTYTKLADGEFERFSAAPDGTMLVLTPAARAPRPSMDPALTGRPKLDAIVEASRQALIARARTPSPTTTQPPVLVDVRRRTSTTLALPCFLAAITPCTVKTAFFLADGQHVLVIQSVTPEQKTTMSTWDGTFHSIVNVRSGKILSQTRGQENYLRLRKSGREFIATLDETGDKVLRSLPDGRKLAFPPELPGEAIGYSVHRSGSERTILIQPDGPLQLTCDAADCSHVSVERANATSRLRLALAWRRGETGEVVLASMPVKYDRETELHLLDVETGRVRKLPPLGKGQLTNDDIAIVSDGERILVKWQDPQKHYTPHLALVDVGSGKTLWNVPISRSETLNAMEADGKIFLVVNEPGVEGTRAHLYRIDPQTGALALTDARSVKSEIYPVRFDPASGEIWCTLARDGISIDVATGRFKERNNSSRVVARRWMLANAAGTHALADHYRELEVFDLVTGRHSPLLGLGGVSSGAVLQGRSGLVGTKSGRVVQVGIADGRIEREFPSHITALNAVIPLPKQNRLVSVSNDGQIRISELSGKPVASILLQVDGKRLIVTPEGFLDGDEKTLGTIGIRGKGSDLIVLSGRMRALQRPDLVMEKLAGDKDGKVRQAAAKLDLKYFAQRAAMPNLRLTQPVDGAGAGESVTAVAEIDGTGAGKGLQLEWRVNGQTAGVDVVEPRKPGKVLRIERVLDLDAGLNRIELASAPGTKDAVFSDPLSVTVRSTGTKSSRPRLFLLTLASPDLNARASVDFQAVRDVFSRQGEAIFASVETRRLPGDADADALKAEISRIAADVTPKDAVLFHYAGRGEIADGKLRLLLGPGPVASEELDTALAGLPARKAILAYDISEPDNAARTRSGVDLLGAIERLTKASGRSSFVAIHPTASGDGPGPIAALLGEAVTQADTDGDRMIDVTELAAFFDRRVRERGKSESLVSYIKITGSDWPAMAAAVSRTSIAIRDLAPTHVLVDECDVYAAPDEGTQKVGHMDAGTSVRLVERKGEWALVARDGKDIGYVAASAVVAIQ